MMDSLIGTDADWVVATARIVLGVIFFAHGAQKMLGWYGGSGLASSMRTFTEHLHLPSTLAFLVIAGELFGGVGLIVGLFSRFAALFIAVTMVGAIATVHFRFGFFLNWFGTQEGHGIEYHLLAIALALVVIVKGSGACSVDRLIYKHVTGQESHTFDRNPVRRRVQRSFPPSFDRACGDIPTSVAIRIEG
jgi:putative oxidoreductase